MTAAEYAAILDPERKVEGWWKECTEIKAAAQRLSFICTNPATRTGVTYIGPPDLHTARSEAWRGEEWLEAHLCWWQRYTPVTFVYDAKDNRLSTDDDHAAAIAEAVRRVNDATR